MKLNTFPNTDLSVSQLCFGCWGVTSDAHWGERDQCESEGAILAAIESGINFFDTAPMYGNGASEDMLGRVLAACGQRSQVVIANKIRPDRMRPAQIVAECETSLARLQTDYIDLYQTHWTNREVPLSDSWDAMLRLQEQGKVRHVGVCNMGLGDLADVVAKQVPMTNQLPYNLLWRMIEAEIVPYCLEHAIGVLVYSPLMHGILADKYSTAAAVPDGRARSRHFSGTRSLSRHGEAGCEAETFATLDRIRAIANSLGRSMSDVALAWTLQQPAIVSVIAGARNAQQLRENVQQLENPLSTATLAELDEATRSLQQALGPNPDMWDGQANSRYR